MRGENIKTVYEDTSNMAADIHTKSFVTEEAWTHAQELINVFDPKKLDTLTQAMYDELTPVLALGTETRKATKKVNVALPARLMSRKPLQLNAPLKTIAQLNATCATVIPNISAMKVGTLTTTSMTSAPLITANGAFINTKCNHTSTHHHLPLHLIGYVRPLVCESSGDTMPTR